MMSHRLHYSVALLKPGAAVECIHTGILKDKYINKYIFFSYVS